MHIFGGNNNNTAPVVLVVVEFVAGSAVVRVRQIMGNCFYSR